MVSGNALGLDAGFRGFSGPFLVGWGQVHQVLMCSLPRLPAFRAQTSRHGPSRCPARDEQSLVLRGNAQENQRGGCGHTARAASTWAVVNSSILPATPQRGAWDSHRVGGAVIVMGSFVLVGKLFEKTGWKAHFEGRDYTEVHRRISSMFPLLTVLTTFLGNWASIFCR